LEAEEIKKQIGQINKAKNWVQKKIFLKFNKSQYNALLKGYQPHWDMRYGIHFEDGYFYNYRSGWIVGKFKVEKIEGDLYQVTELYDNPEKSDCNVVFDSLKEACDQNHVTIDLEHLSLMFKRTYAMQEE